MCVDCLEKFSSTIPFLFSLLFCCRSISLCWQNKQYCSIKTAYQHLYEASEWYHIYCDSYTHNSSVQSYRMNTKPIQLVLLLLLFWKSIQLIKSTLKKMHSILFYCGFASIKSKNITYLVLKMHQKSSQDNKLNFFYKRKKNEQSNVRITLNYLCVSFVLFMIRSACTRNEIKRFKNQEKVIGHRTVQAAAKVK